ncbi:MAG: hypothetical protein ACLUSV_01615 [Streptococcus sp.]
MYRFKDFLIEVTLRNNHQVVIDSLTQLLRIFLKRQ